MGYRSCTKRTACAAWRWGKSGRCLSLLFLCSLTALLYGNSTGIVREGLPLDFYNLLIDLFVFLVGGDAAHDKSRKIGRQASRHVGTGRDKLYHLRTRVFFQQAGTPAHPDINLLVLFTVFLPSFYRLFS